MGGLDANGGGGAGRPLLFPLSMPLSARVRALDPLLQSVFQVVTGRVPECYVSCPIHLGSEDRNPSSSNVAQHCQPFGKLQFTAKVWSALWTAPSKGLSPTEPFDLGGSCGRWILTQNRGASVTDPPIPPPVRTRAIKNMAQNALFWGRKWGRGKTHTPYSRDCCCLESCSNRVFLFLLVQANPFGM